MNNLSSLLSQNSKNVGEVGRSCISRCESPLLISHKVVTIHEQGAKWIMNVRFTNYILE